MGLLLEDTYMDICVKYVKFSSMTNLAHPVVEEELGLMLPHYLKKIQKSVSQDMKSRLHMSMLLMQTNTCIEDALSKSDKKTTEEKKRLNELYIGKVIKAAHFLAAYNLLVKELYSKLVSFLADDIEEPVVKQDLDTCKKIGLINLQMVATPFFYC